MLLDTSAIVDQLVSKLIDEGKLENASILVPGAVMAELEQLSESESSSEKKTREIRELDKLESIKERSESGLITYRTIGDRPSLADTTLNRIREEIDHQIIELARKKVLFC